MNFIKGEFKRAALREGQVALHFFGVLMSLVMSELRVPLKVVVGIPLGILLLAIGLAHATFYLGLAAVFTASHVCGNVLFAFAKRQIAEMLVGEHRLPVQRACRTVRLSRAAYYRPPVPASRRDAVVIAPDGRGGAVSALGFLEAV